MEDISSQAAKDLPLNFLQGFTKAEDKVGEFHPRSPCFIVTQALAVLSKWNFRKEQLLSVPFL